jgi:hypothetical protein
LRSIALTYLECADRRPHRDISRPANRHCDFDIGGLHTWPFGARTEKPAAPANNTRWVKYIAWNKKVGAFTTAQISTDNDALGRSVGMKH